MGDGVGRTGAEREGRGDGGGVEKVFADGVGALAFDRPEDVGEPELAGGELGHDGDFDVAEARRMAAVGGDAGEGPGAALVVHEGAGAVDGVEDEAELGLILG